MEHFKISDEVGIPSTIGAVIFNLMAMFNLSNINMLLTLVISALSIAYLCINIYLKIKEIKKLKDEEKSTS
jgi:amino acid transporter